MVVQRSGLLPGEAERVLPLDDLLPDAEIVIDRATSLAATPESIWPWLVQLGKDRAGWYFPRSVERFVPAGHRGAHQLEPQYQRLTIGEHVLDWGPGRPTLEAVVVAAPYDLGFRSTRGRTTITWVLHLEPDGAAASRLHLRLRIHRQRDWLTPVIAYGGGIFDWLTVIGLFAGLRDRLAEPQAGASR